MKNVRLEIDRGVFIADMYISVSIPGHPTGKEFRRGAMDTQSDLNLIPYGQLESLGISDQELSDTNMVPVRIRTIGEGDSSIITPKGFVIIEWHMRGHSNITYRDKFYVLPSHLTTRFDCLIGQETIIREGFVLRNHELLCMNRV